MAKRSTPKPKPPTERSQAQIKAERNYEAKRAKTPIGTRVDDALLARIDKARDNASRSEFLLDAIQEKLRSR